MRLAFLVSLAAALAGCPGRAGSEAIGPDRSGEAWLVTELAGRHIGHSVTRMERFDEGWRFENTMHMDLAMMGVDQQVRVHSVATASPDLRLESVTFHYEGQGRVMDAVAVVQENNLIIKAAGDQSRARPLDEPLYPTEALGRLALRAEAAGKERFEVPVFDVSTMSVDRVRVKLEGWEPVRAGDATFHALRVRVTSSLFAVTGWYDSLGLTVVEEAPPGIRSFRATPAEAVAGVGGKAGVDLLQMFRVEVDTTVESPDRVRRVRLKLSGVGADELPRDIGEVTELEPERHSLCSCKLLVLEISTEPPAGTLSLPVAGQDSFLLASVTIQCDAPEIRDRAAAVLAKERDAVQAARMLVHWVYENVEKVPTASFPTALDVLRNPQGDCNEHAVLYAGLARAAGLPARVAVGLAYMDRAFYYHAWNEVWLGRWVPVDPTFNEFPASALHLKLAEGDLREQARILPLVGRIGIRILELDY
ncbi:MAG TPA: transglutaminase domain-containing protein [candidate division WOR-3 bacterium]|uniref:Transglutaminase domain-containing protein n=1 Tax=candidate division WOR-3 bacterium TaxID=2052148 RepID=A0A7V0T4F2_UNCW3|nr:transglutaminase domain-containing protein [candidate division WOR-3 bacterium]